MSSARRWIECSISSGALERTCSFWIRLSFLVTDVRRAVPQSLKHLPFDFDHIVSAQVAKVHYNLAGRSQVCIPTADRPVKMFMRDKFDAYLAHQCGAEVCDGCTVREVTEEPQGIRIVTE
jgi:hypothetical protein